jgi:hypothetical protein
MLPAMTDKLDWHWDAAIEAGQPGEYGFVHIACFLAWAIERGLHSKRYLPRRLVEQSRSGTAQLGDFIDATDAKLTHDNLNAEGNGFAHHLYHAYLERYDQLFEATGQYAVQFDAPARRAVANLLDELYKSWVDGGRPDAPRLEDIEDEASRLMPTLTPAAWDDFEQSLNPHDRPDLEHLLPDISAT